MDYATSPDEIDAVFADMRSDLDAKEHRSRVAFAERRARLYALERDVRDGIKSLSYERPVEMSMGTWGSRDDADAPVG